MFFDPGTKPEVKADPLSLESLIAWLEKKPASEIYCYIDRGRCLAAQYNKFIGRHYSVCSIKGPKSFDRDLENIAVMEPYTFGAAIERARALSRT